MTACASTLWVNVVVVVGGGGCVIVNVVGVALLVVTDHIMFSCGQ